MFENVIRQEMKLDALKNNGEMLRITDLDALKYAYDQLLTNLNDSKSKTILSSMLKNLTDTITMFDGNNQVVLSGGLFTNYLFENSDIKDLVFDELKSTSEAKKLNYNQITEKEALNILKEMYLTEDKKVKDSLQRLQGTNIKK